MRDTTKKSGSTAIQRRDKADDDVVPNKTESLARTNVSSPNNYGRLLPSEYYFQFREWNTVFSTLKNKRNLAQLTWINSFRFKLDIGSLGDWSASNQMHVPPSIQNWNSERGGGNDNRNRGYDQGRGGDRRNNDGGCGG